MGLTSTGIFKRSQEVRLGADTLSLSLLLGLGNLYSMSCTVK